MTTNYQERPRKGGGTECIFAHSSDSERVDYWRRLLPIAFTAENAQKVHDGTKTQTRRLLNSPQPGASKGRPKFDMGRVYQGRNWDAREQWHPRYRIGDVLWVQEPWRTAMCLNGRKPTDLPTDATIRYGGDPFPPFGKLRPGRFLPLRFARSARYRVTAVRCERVDSISEADALAEGCKPDNYTEAQKRGEYLGAVNRFSVLWDSIHGKQPGKRFSDGPFVWAYTFERAP